jgi:lysophospholipase L1-like esterase
MYRLKVWHVGVAIALMLAGGIWWYVGSRPPTITNYPTAGTNIIAFGDSLVAGVGATRGSDLVSLLSAALATQVKNMGRSGDTTADALTRLDDVIKDDPKLVIVILGGNDVLRQEPVLQTFENLRYIIEHLQAVGAAVVLVGVPGGLLADRYDQGFQDLARTYGVAYVPNVLRGIIGHAEYMSDAVHPNDAGYRKMAARILPVVQEVLAGAVAS